jgi:CheY-like chemotaxis protein
VGVRRINHTSKRQNTMPRMLIVDDDVSAADSLASLLQSSGYGDARVAYTGTTALALAAEFLPTVLLVDLDLPEMSGYDVARQLSQHPKLQGLRLIALTNSSEHPRRELAREAGIERYLSKPVGSADLDELFSQAGNPASTARPRDTRANKA